MLTLKAKKLRSINRIKRLLDGLQLEFILGLYSNVAIKLLYEIVEEYEIDAINDLIPICHLVIHSREPAYTANEVKKMIKKDNLNKNK